MKKLITIGSLLLASLSLANAQIYLFDFFGTSDSTNSTESTGVAVSGTVDVDVGAGSIEFNINNLSDGSSYPYADLVGFGFWNEPAGGGTPYTYTGISTTDPGNWTSTNSFPELWSGSYHGAVADSPTGFQQNGIDGGASAMFAFTGASGGPLALQGLVDAWTNEGVVSNSSSDQHDIRFRFQSVGDDNEGSEKLYLNLRPVPEPSTYGMIGASALVLLVIARRFRKKK